MEIEEIIETCGDIVSSSSNSLEFDLEPSPDRQKPNTTNLVIQSPAKYKSIEKKNINRSITTTKKSKIGKSRQIKVELKTATGSNGQPTIEYFESPPKKDEVDLKKKSQFEQIRDIIIK